MTNDIIIKSGINIDSEDFKNYYNELKQLNIDCYYLDLAVNTKSPVLINPLKFKSEEYIEYNVDDISFIIKDNEIIGHMFYNLQQTKSHISLGLTSGNHLDMERLKNASGLHIYSKIEYYCRYNINLNGIVIEYLRARTNGNLEYQGTITNENKIHIKKQ